MTTIYDYVAQTNPSCVRILLNKYGYHMQGVRTKDQLGTILSQLVSKEGEPAFKDVLDHHPDKEVILEHFAGAGAGVGGPSAVKFSNFDGEYKTATLGGCGCSKCSGHDHYRNADGAGSGAAGLQSFTSISALTNVSIIAAAMLITAAIVTNNNRK